MTFPILGVVGEHRVVWELVYSAGNSVQHHEFPNVAMLPFWLYSVDTNMIHNM